MGVEPKVYTEFVDDRARVDEDFKHYVVHTMFSEGSVRSSGEALKHWCKHRSDIGRKWEKEYTIARNVASQAYMTWEGPLGIAEDASRQGRPKKDTMLYSLLDGRN